MEALASFGGSSFDSMSVKKVDLRIKLKREADQRKRREEGGGEEPQAKRPRTRYVPYASLEQKKIFFINFRSELHSRFILV